MNWYSFARTPHLLLYGLPYNNITRTPSKRIGNRLLVLLVCCYNKNMKKSIKSRNVKAQVPLQVKGDVKTELAIKNPPNLRPSKDKHGK